MLPLTNTWRPITVYNPAPNVWLKHNIHYAVRSHVLENLHTVRNSAISRNGQPDWLDAANVLQGKFCYFNSTDTTFDEIGHYIA